MRKKLYIIIILFTFMLTGCATKERPADLEDDDYRDAKQITVVIDHYLDKRITEREAYEEIESLSRTFSSDAPFESTENKLYHIAFKTIFIFLNGTYEPLDLEKVKEYKEEILECIGE